GTDPARTGPTGTDPASTGLTGTGLTSTGLTGTGLSGADLAGTDLAGTMAALRSAARRHHLVVLNPAAATNQNVLAVTGQSAREHGLGSLPDLARYRGPLVLGGPAECPSRPYCQPGLVGVYGIHFTGFRRLDPGGPLTRLALKTNQVQLGLL